MQYHRHHQRPSTTRLDDTATNSRAAGRGVAADDAGDARGVRPAVRGSRPEGCRRVRLMATRGKSYVVLELASSAGGAEGADGGDAGNKQTPDDLPAASSRQERDDDDPV